MRSKVHKILVALALALPLATGCAVYHVLPTEGGCNPAFRETDRSFDDDGAVDFKERVVRIYLDGCGHLRPDPAKRPIDTAELQREKCCLKSYFMQHGGYDPEAISQESARQIAQVCEPGRCLIVLIHGTSSSYPEAHRAYKAARLQVLHQYPERKFAYLEVFWDGLYGSPLAIWAQVQNQSKWAGLGLRLLLRRLDPSTPIRVLTHSRGASVICAALWNTPLRDTAETDRLYRQAQDSVPPPTLPDLRLGLLAPAMRPVDFECYFDRGKGDVYYHDRIILGVNEDDYALNAGGLPGIAGTTLGCRPALFDEVIAPLLNRGRAHAFLVDFSGSSEHNFYDYLFRDCFEKQLLPKLLGEEGAPTLTKSDRRSR